MKCMDYINTGLQDFPQRGIQRVGTIDSRVMTVIKYVGNKVKYKQVMNSVSTLRPRYQLGSFITIYRQPNLLFKSYKISLIFETSSSLQYRLALFFFL